MVCRWGGRVEHVNIHTDMYFDIHVPYAQLCMCTHIHSRVCIYQNTCRKHVSLRVYTEVYVYVYEHM